jgi:hypothetical protein
MFISIYLTTVLYVYIDIFKKFKYFILRYFIEAFYCNFSIYHKSHYTILVYITVFLKMNPRVRNI